MGVERALSLYQCRHLLLFLIIWFREPMLFSFYFRTKTKPTINPYTHPARVLRTPNGRAGMPEQDRVEQDKLDRVAQEAEVAQQAQQDKEAENLRKEANKK